MYEGHQLNFLYDMTILVESYSINPLRSQNQNQAISTLISEGICVQELKKLKQLFLKGQRSKFSDDNLRFTSSSNEAI